MYVNIEALQNLAKDRKWSIPELANRLNIDYSYLFRILNREKNGGAKLFSGIYILCREEKINIDDYIFLNKPLSGDNGEIKPTGTEGS